MSDVHVFASFLRRALPGMGWLGLCFLAMLWASPLAQAQDFLGVANANNSALTSIDLQPASIADSRIKLQVGLVGMNLDFANNAFRSPSRELRTLYTNVPDDAPTESFLTMNRGVDPVSALSRVNLYLPSVMVGFENGGAFALTLRNRTYVSADGVPQTFAYQLYREREERQDWFRNIQADDMRAQALNFMELGFAYGQPVLNTGEHFMKVGARLKVLMGLGAAYIAARDLDMQFENFDQDADADTIRVRANGDFNYGYSANLPVNQANENAAYDPSITALPTVGGDMGVVYEWRPRWQEYRYNMDGQTDLDRVDLNKYKLRVGFSLLDLGSIRFKTGALSREILVRQDTTIDVDDFDPETVEQWDSLVNQYASIRQSNPYFNIQLPFRMSFQADFHVAEGFYLNLTTLTGFRLNQERGTRELSVYSFTPRYELKYFMLGLPLSINGFGHFNAGVAARLGPLVVGSNSLLSPLINNNVYGTDFYFAIDVPLYKKIPKDRDRDEVSDGVDECREVPGAWAFRGCPDTDGDGVEDRQDQCPTEPGLAEFGGCPDTDGDGIENRVDDCPSIAGLQAFRGCPDRDADGIEDRQDECPDSAGLALFKGCPDRDGDGVEDRQDRCVDVAGLSQFRGCPDIDGDNIPDVDDSCATTAGIVAFNGCPDTDGDGTQDRQDACPTKPGPIAQKGCPDTDGDGLHDHMDSCPEQPGPITNEGCPLRDTDGDGVPDKDDLCPTVRGLRDNNGCPEVARDQEILEVLRTAFDNLEFETGKAIIRNSSYPSLLELVEVLKKRPNYRILISGHTDNVGDDRSNQRLSEGRATAVKLFLQDNGIEPGRIVAQGFGESRPVASNATDEGRAKNRRVELEVVTTPQ